MWLRLACLAVSIGLHAGLGVIGWQGFEARSGDDGPMVVALIERPSQEPMPSASSAPTASGPKASASVPARRATPRPPVSPAQIQPSPEQKPDPLCAVPEATVDEETAATAPAASAVDSNLTSGGGTALDVSLVNGGTGSGSGSIGQGLKHKGEGDGGGGIIKATPRYESNPLPNYPRLARQNRLEGTVRLRARVTASGNVEGVSLERSSGHAVLDRSALDGVQRWRFIPATRNGAPVACEVSIPVAFRLTE
ncbi:MAG: energy transducer TonB [Desulfuromonadales bacterium]|nr:energy transducer TonB [Desulfuromonadales bacterium]